MRIGEFDPEVVATAFFAESDVCFRDEEYRLLIHNLTRDITQMDVLGRLMSGPADLANVVTAQLRVLGHFIDECFVDRLIDAVPDTDRCFLLVGKEATKEILGRRIVMEITELETVLRDLRSYLRVKGITERQFLTDSPVGPRLSLKTMRMLDDGEIITISDLLMVQPYGLLRFKSS
jgi:hypothetical protein